MHRLDDKLITQKKQMRISLNYGYVEEKKRERKGTLSNNCKH